jgi:hypothetical protein
MRSDQGFRSSAFGFQKLRMISALCFRRPAFDPSEISNLKSQIRTTAGGRLHS